MVRAVFCLPLLVQLLLLPIAAQRSLVPPPKSLVDSPGADLVVPGGLVIDNGLEGSAAANRLSAFAEAVQRISGDSIAKRPASGGSTRNRPA